MELVSFTLEDFAQLNDAVHISERKKNVIESRLVKTKNRHEKRRFNSEESLNLLFGEIDTNLTYHVISGGDIDSMSYIQLCVKRNEIIEFLLLSTWCMAMTDVLQIKTWLENGNVKRIDVYVGEIFQNQYPEVYETLCKALEEFSGKLVIFRNHAKVCIGYGDKFNFCIESSANINTNPRTEQTVVCFDNVLVEFYKEFFDGIKSFNARFDAVEKWNKCLHI